MQMASRRRERRVGGGGPGDQQRRVAHQPPGAGQLVEGAAPRLPEGDGVVGQFGPGPVGAEVQHHRRRRVPQPHRPPGRPAQQPVRDGQVRGEDDRVAGDPLLARDHRRDPAAGPLQPGHLPPEPQIGARVGGGVRHRPRQRVHAAEREVHPGDRVHVRDHRVRGQRPRRRGHPRTAPGRRTPGAAARPSGSSRCARPAGRTRPAPPAAPDPGGAGRAASRSSRR